MNAHKPFRTDSPSVQASEKRVTLRHPSGVIVETWPANAELYLMGGFVLILTQPLMMSA